MTGSGHGGAMRVTLCFDPDFDLFLPADRRGGPVEIMPGHATTVKDLVESCGVPHTEIGAIVLSGSVMASFSTRISDGERIEVLPVRPASEGGSPLQPVLPETARFAADIHLGKAARRLRLLGFDTVLFRGSHDSGLLDIMEREGRILLTRDRRLLMHNRVVYGCCIRSDHVSEQVRQVVIRYGLAGSAKPFSRCLACNAPLEKRSKAAVEHRLQPKTKLYYEVFEACGSCGRIYWEGSHMQKLRALVAEALNR